MPSHNEFRIFISSTFRDLKEDREHLVRKIFPEIRAICRERDIGRRLRSAAISLS